MNGSPTNCTCCVAPGREDVQGPLCRSVDSLFALRHKLVMDQSFLVKKVMSITLILDFDILTFFGLGDPGDFASSSQDCIEKPMFHLQ